MGHHFDGLCALRVQLTQVVEYFGRATENHTLVLLDLGRRKKLFLHVVPSRLPEQVVEAYALRAVIVAFYRELLLRNSFNTVEARDSFDNLVIA